MKKTYFRRFGGKTENFESKEERRFEQAHLKAYLKAKRTFRHGPMDELGNRPIHKTAIIEGYV